MKTITKTALATIMLSLAAVPAYSLVQADGKKEHKSVQNEEHRSFIEYKNIITVSEALSIARKRVKGDVVRILLEDENIPTYLVEIMTDDGFKFITIAADTGRLIDPSHAEDQLRALLNGKNSSAKIVMSLEQSIDLVTKKTKGRIISAETEVEDDMPVYFIMVMESADKVKEYTVSSESGKIIRISDAHILENEFFHEDRMND